MRLETQLDIADRALQNLPEPVFNQQGPSNYFIAKGKTKYRKALDELRAIPYFSEHVDLVLTLAPFQIAGDEFTLLNAPQAAEFKGALDVLLTRLRILRDVLHEAVIPSSDTTIAFRLPPFKDFSELQSLADRIGKIFWAVLSNYKGDPDIGFEIVGFDVGSSWLKISTKTATGLGLVAALATASNYVAQQYGVWQQQIAFSTKINAGADLSKDAEKLFTQYADLSIQQQAKLINDAHYKADPEQQNRLADAIREMAKLVREGAEIQPAKLPAPDAKIHFPDMKAISEGIQPKLLESAGGVSKPAAKK